MKKLIYILLVHIAMFSAIQTRAQGLNNNSDFHVPPQVPTIPPAPTIATIAPAVAAPEVTISPVTTVANASLLPTTLDIPAMPTVPPEIIAVNTTAPLENVIAPTVVNNTPAPGGINTPAPATITNLSVTQPIPTLPPVPPLPAIPELQLSL